MVAAAIPPVENAKLQYLASVERLLREAEKANENRRRLLALIEDQRQEQEKGASDEQP